MRTGFSTWGHYVYAQQKRSLLDLDRVWSEVAEAGFLGIEISWPLDQLQPPRVLRKQLDRYGLMAVSHWVNVTFAADCVDEAHEKAQFLRDVGGRVLVCEGVKQAGPMTKEQHCSLYRQFDAIGRVCEKQGILAAFHFHRGCLETEDEVCEFFDNTEGVWFCPDIGHAAALGWDPIPVIRE